MCHQTNWNPSVPCLVPYRRNLAHSSEVSPVLAVEEVVPHTLLELELNTSPSLNITLSLKGTSLVQRVVPLLTALYWMSVEGAGSEVGRAIHRPHHRLP